MRPFTFRCEYAYGNLRFYPVSVEAVYICKVARRQTLTLDEVEGLGEAFEREVRVTMEKPVRMEFGSLTEFKAFAPGGIK